MLSRFAVVGTFFSLLEAYQYWCVRFAVLSCPAWSTVIWVSTFYGSPLRREVGCLMHIIIFIPPLPSSRSHALPCSLFSFRLWLRVDRESRVVAIYPNPVEQVRASFSSYSLVLASVVGLPHMLVALSRRK